ncbi:MAG: nitrate ABC transporter ATP-binding protein, partial [Deltaproteobacteria bacterium]
MRFECQQLCKTYSGSDLTVSVLENVSFTAEAGEFLCIVGPSGCGKTTLLRLIAELSEPTSGQVCFEKAQNSGHPRSAMVFQEHGLFLWMTVLDNVAFGLEMQGVAKAERHERAR